MQKTNLILVILGAVLTLTGCSRNESSAKKAATPVPVLAAPAVAKTMPVQVRAIGNVTPLSKVTIRSQITGQLDKIHFKEGQEVHKGDLLFTIDARPAQAALARDQAQLNNARSQFARDQKLLDQKLISQDVYDSSKANHETWAATVQVDELNLNYCKIFAPVDGVVGAQLVYPGNIIKAEDDEMATINQIHPINVSFAVAERFLPKIKNELSAGGLKVEVDFEGLQGDAPVGELTFVDNAVDTTTGTIQLKAMFANANDKLWQDNLCKQC